MKKTYNTVVDVELCIQRLQMLVLGRIEKLDWSGARRYSHEIGRMIQRKVEIQHSDVRNLPLFKGRKI